MTKQFAGKKVLVSGAAGGIGAALCGAFLEEGAQVIGVWHNDRAALDALTQNPDFAAVRCCLEKPEEVATLFEKLAKEKLLPDILINNAGVDAYGLCQDLSVEEWDSLIAVNLRAPFLCAQYALPHMLERQAGVILNVSSIWGRVGASCEVAYSASKGGLDAMTKALAKELGPSGIRVNALSCGYIDTKMNAAYTEEETKAFLEQVPLCRVGEPEEVAKAAVFLCSEAASYISGAILAVDGAF